MCVYSRNLAPMRKLATTVSLIALLTLPLISFAQENQPSGGYCPHLTQNLKRGDSDATKNGEVTELQKFLFQHNQFQADLYDTYVSGYFGRLTQQNVIRFQMEQGIIPASGFVGPITRAAIARVCGSQTTNNTSSQITTCSMAVR